MKNWIRTILTCFVLVGGTAFFAYYTLSQFNKALDDTSASFFSIAKLSPIPVSAKTNKEQIPTTAPEIIPPPAAAPTTTTAAAPTDLKLAFIFPKISNVYIGCAYQLSFQLSTTIRSLETVLVDAGSRDTVEPVVSGLAKEYKIEPDSQSLDWNVGEVFPGEYYIKVSNINGIIRSKVFTIRKMPKGISADEKEKICKESDGSF